MSNQTTDPPETHNGQGVEERRLVRRLRALAKDWPDGYWLFSANGRLHLMRDGSDGMPQYTSDGGVDPEYEVMHIDIPNDGGDW